MRLMAEDDTEGIETRMRLLRFWLILYAFVGTQLAWTLRPFFGRPGTSFVLFRELDGNFYLSIFQAIQEILDFKNYLTSGIGKTQHGKIILEAVF
jgi:hypothetical protein